MRHTSSSWFRCLTLAALASACAAAPAAPHTVYLVRHAERGGEPAADPGLTPAGQQRALALAEALAAAKVQGIITTALRRTQATAAPLALAQNLPVQVIASRRGDAPGHVAEVAAAVRALSGTVLVVGHSNTVPAIVAALGGPTLPDLCESSFDRIFVLRPDGGGQPASLALLRYGEPGAQAQAGCL